MRMDDLSESTIILSAQRQAVDWLGTTEDWAGLALLGPPLATPLLIIMSIVTLS